MVCISENVDNNARPLTYNVLLNTHDTRTKTEINNTVITDHKYKHIHGIFYSSSYALVIGTHSQNRRWMNYPAVKKILVDIVQQICRFGDR